MSIQPVVLDDQTSRLLVTALDGLNARQSVLAQNLANANTPGYTRLDVNFTEQLRQALRAGDAHWVNSPEFEPLEDHEPPARLDGNNVHVPLELNQMMQNGLAHQLMVRAFSTRVAILKAAIQGGA